jgi:hypothetical protein
MVSLEVMALVLTGLGLTVSMVYYANQLAHQNKTRKAQLFMNLQQRFDNPQLMRALIQSRDYEGIPFEEWNEKYGPNTNREIYTDWVCLQNAIQGIGLLVETNQVDAKLVDDLMGSIIYVNWKRSGPIIIELRRILGRAGAWNQVEKLYNVLQEIPH